MLTTSHKVKESPHGQPSSNSLNSWKANDILLHFFIYFHVSKYTKQVLFHSFPTPFHHFELELQTHKCFLLLKKKHF